MSCRLEGGWHRRGQETENGLVNPPSHFLLFPGTGVTGVTPVLSRKLSREPLLKRSTQKPLFQQLFAPTQEGGQRRFPAIPT